MTQKIKSHINGKVSTIFNPDIVKPIMKLAVPMIFVSLLQSAYQLTDAFWVGRLGGDAVAAVSVSFPINFLLMSLGMGLTIASSTLISQYIGAKNQKMVNHVATQSLIMIFVVSIILTLVGYFISPYILQLMKVEPHIYPNAVSFLKISMLGILATYIFTLFQSVMRATGEMKTSSYIIMTTVALNFILDPLFIFGYKSIPGYGVTGAAIATFLTQILAAVVSLIILFGGKHDVDLKTKDLVPDYDLIKKIFRLGLPASIEQSNRSLGMVVTTFIVASFGAIATAAYGVGTNVLMFTIIPMVGVSIATSILAGQSIGAKNIDRAVSIVNTSSIISFTGITIFGLTAFIFAKEIVSIFLHNDPATATIAIDYVRHMAPFFGFIGLQMALLGAFRAAGDTKLAMNLTLAGQWIIQLPIAFVLAKMYGTTGLWLSFPISWILSYLLALYHYKKGTWKNKNIIDNFSKEERKQEKILEETKIESVAR